MRGKIVRYFLLSILACAVMAFIVVLFGRVEGEEFCPQKFTVQQFSYYQIPLTRIQITPVSFSSSARGNPTLSKHLRSQRMLGSVSSQLRWDIIYLGNTSSRNNLGDADILVKYLEQPGAVGSENWLDWTKNKDNAGVVRVFWPLIAQLADERLYILMPDVFDQARRASSGEAFVSHVQSTLPVKIRRLAEAERSRERTSLATHLEELAGQIASLPMPMSPMPMPMPHSDGAADAEPANAPLESDSESVEAEAEIEPDGTEID